MFVPSNVNVPVAEILWKFSVWWCFVFCQLHSVVSITSCPLHRNCPVDTVKCYFCFSRSFYEMYVSIVNMYQSLLVSLFFRHFYLLISASIQLDAYRVTEFGQHSCVDKWHYSRDDLQSLNISISPISNSICAKIIVLEFMLRAIYVSGGSLENETVSGYRKMVKYSLFRS